jgi:4-hydroxyphenylpyruvate dioxygenase
MKFSQITFWVSDSKITSSYFTTCFGFDIINYTGLETGDECVSTYTCRNGKIDFVFQSPLTRDAPKEMFEFLSKHGDGIRDIAFKVDDCHYIFNAAINRGATSISKPIKHKDGTLRGTIQTLSDITHTFIQGVILYNYPFCVSINLILPQVRLHAIDHIVTNTGNMETIVQWYERILKFKRFWSVDETQIHTKYSALRSIVMTDDDENIKMPINEPAHGLRKSQIQEYLEYNQGDGIQHVALSTNNIIDAVASLKKRGVEFLDIPNKYYDNLKTRLALSKKIINEDLQSLKEYKILVDFDENGYLLQIFTKPIMSKPTLFIEIIERHNFNGFGAGNFKSLFECIEIEQEKRHNL